eukprot:TRINITY_DN33914_c0_g1_i1.p2 TRINITY_DN33914_c0_g1~~TRINITY_DN33914_c0_g1_i1.p2  ORF type:complete len:276 (+),score=67.53 TRINITY_DN33914_c0_g1_i1:90-917(+)
MATEGTATVAGGRRLRWRVYGAADGYPVVFLHGTLNTRLFQPAWEKTGEVTAQAGVRVIAVDRPGYGESDYVPGRRYSTIGADVAAVADDAGVAGSFGIAGFSSGGPNALAAAAGLGSRVSGIVLFSSDAPYKRMGGGLLEKLLGNPDLTQEQATERAQAAAASLREAYAAMQKPERRAVAEADLAEATRQGIDKGPAQDPMLESADWGFELSSVTQHVHLWHGEEDADVPLEAGKYLSEQLPQCTAHFIPGESHTLLRRRWGEALSALAAGATS